MFDQERKPLGHPHNPRSLSILLLFMGGFDLFQVLIPHRDRPLDWLHLLTGVALLVLGGWGLWRAKRVLRLSQDDSGPWVQEAKRRLASGDKIAAIKVVREATGLGLADAKNVVESWES